MISRRAIAIITVVTLVLIAVIIAVSILLWKKKKDDRWDYRIPGSGTDWKTAKSFHDFHEKDVDGILRQFYLYKGSTVKVIFATTTEILKKDGVCNGSIPKMPSDRTELPKILFFPCNQFKELSVGLLTDTVKAVQAECHLHIRFFPAVDINGKSAYSLWQWLVAKTPTTTTVGSEITKVDRIEYEINGEGQVTRRTNVAKTSE